MTLASQRQTPKQGLHQAAVRVAFLMIGYGAEDSRVLRYLVGCADFKALFAGLQPQAQEAKANAIIRIAHGRIKAQSRGGKAA